MVANNVSRNFACGLLTAGICWRISLTMVIGHSSLEGSVAHGHSTRNGLFLLTRLLKTCPKCWIEKSPKILLKMTAVLSKRLRKANELIHSLAFFDVYGKVARTLLNLASERGRVTEQGTVIDMRLTQQELAELAGMTRETMARTLREF